MVDVFISYHEDSAGDLVRHCRSFCRVRFTMGLRRDGTVVATGDWVADRINAAHWTDIRLPD